LECLNCFNKDKSPSIKLAKVLERAWVRGANTRLALPFMHPLLPTIVNESSSGCISTSSIEQTGINTRTSNAFSMDLLAILEKIRRRQYRSVKSFYVDLNQIRNSISCRIAPKEPYDAGCSELFTQRFKSILLSFDTVVDGCVNYLTDKMLIVSNLEQQICLLAESTDPVELCDSASSSSPQFEDIEMVVKEKLDDGALQGQNSSRELLSVDGREVSKGKGKGGGPGANTSSNRGRSESTIATMQKLWRIECEYPIPAMAVKELLRVGSGSRDGDGSIYNCSCGAGAAAAAGVVSPRSSLSDWAQFLERGYFPPQHRGPVDEYGLQSKIVANEQLHEAHAVEQFKVREMLYGCGDPEFSKYAVRYFVCLLHNSNSYVVVFIF
jgi:hypothetical protein